ncbi:MAG: lysophospholipid acyltransferase family protein [Tepidisphaerales bacterium]
MLPETIHRPTLWWWRWYCRYALRRHFHRVMRYGAELPPASPTGTLVLANHVSWWDGITLDAVLRPTHPELRCMIDEVQVRRHPFFRRVGGFSVNRSSPRDAVRACAHAAGLLRDGKTVVMFPQGAIVPAGRPLVLERGFTRILDDAPDAAVLVVALRYEFWEHQRPELLVHIAPPLAGRSAGRDDVTAALAGGLAELARASDQRAAGEVLLRGRKAISEWRWRS